MMKKQTRTILFRIFYTLVALAAISLITQTVLLQKTKKYLKNFTPIPQQQTFVESAPRIYAGKIKQPHGILLLHGYSTSPQSFSALYPGLEKANLPYYAPQITGFGLSRQHTLKAVHTADWLRQAIQAYDLMAAFFDKVSIVGISHGGSLAIYISQHRPVDNLILIGPYVVPNPTDQAYKTALKTPVISTLLQLAYPVFEMPKHASESAQKADVTIPKEFYYPTMPTHSLLALWGTQDKIDIKKARFKTMTVLYGTNDKTSNMRDVLRLFDQAKISYDVIPFQNAPHNLLWGSTGVETALTIMKILKPEK